MRRQRGGRQGVISYSLKKLSCEIRDGFPESMCSKEWFLFFKTDSFVYLMVQ